MKILVTGCAGYVGSLVMAHLTPRHVVTGVDVACETGTARLRCDLCDADAVTRLARAVQPDVVVHAAGNKNIDFCEKHPQAAFQINCEAVKNVSRAFGGSSRIIYISTDYVFDGIRGNYTESDTPVPLTVYGQSKLRGEEEGRLLADGNFITVRMSALYDLHAAFPTFLLDRFSGGERVDCYSDARYSPTYSRDFLAALDVIIGTPTLAERLIHVCGEATTRFDFARAFAGAFGFDPALVREASAAGKGGYLFKDLSLNNRRQRTVLGVTPTAIADALQELKQGVNT